MIDPKGEVGGTATGSAANGMLLADAAAAGIRPSCSGVESVGEAVRAHAHAHTTDGSIGTGGGLLLGRVGGDAEGGDGGMVGDGSGNDAAGATAAGFARSKAAIAIPIFGSGNLGRRATSVWELGNALGPGLGRTSSCLLSSAPVVAGDRHRHRHRHRPRLGDGRRRWPGSGTGGVATLLRLLTGLGLGLGLGTGCDDGRSTDRRRW